MIKASYDDDQGRRHYVFGLSYENLDRLRQNKPIRFDLAEVGGTGTVFIFAGSTEGSIERMFREKGFLGPHTKITQKPRPGPDDAD